MLAAGPMPLRELWRQVRAARVQGKLRQPPVPSEVAQAMPDNSHPARLSEEYLGVRAAALSCPGAPTDRAPDTDRQLSPHGWGKRLEAVLSWAHV